MASNDFHLEGAPFLKQQTAGLYEPAGSKSLGEAAVRSTKHNRQITDAIPYWQDWREAVHRIKAYTVANLDKLLVQFEQNITARGATVLFASDAAEAPASLMNSRRLGSAGPQSPEAQQRLAGRGVDREGAGDLPAVL